MIHLKSDREIEQLRVSADLVSRTLGELARHVAPGITTAELDRIAEEYIRDHGAVPAFKGYQVGKEVFPATLCTSVNEEVVHGIPSDRVLEDGDLLSADCGVIINGFYGDSAFTFAVGSPSEDNKVLCTATHDALQAGVSQAIGGNRLGDIGAAVQTVCEDGGFGVVRDLVGHGIGRHLHEDPQVPNYGRQGTGRKLKTGLVICIEPMVNRGTSAVETESDGWTVQTADSSVSAHYEHMVVVRKGKPEVLTSFSYVEQILEELPYNTNLEMAHG